MKKVKLSILTVLTLFLTSSIFYSCLNENDKITQEDEINEVSRIHNSIEFNNKEYVVNDNGEVSKYENGNFKYNITLDDNIKGKVIIHKDKKNSRNRVTEVGNENIRIENELTGEYIDVINIVKYDTYYTFDAVNNLGQTLNGFKFNLTEENVNSKLHPGWWIGGLIIEAIVDLLTDSPMAECTAAMNALNCDEGTTPYMNFSDGWFGTSCSVGCH